MPLKYHMILVTWSWSHDFRLRKCLTGKRWLIWKLEPTTWRGNSFEFHFFLIDEISWKYWNLDWWISIEVIFAKVEFWYRKLRSLNCIKFTFWNFWRNFWGWMLKPLLIGSNSLCDFQENLFGIAVFSPDLLVCRDPRTKTEAPAFEWSDQAVRSGCIARTRTRKVWEI